MKAFRKSLVVFLGVLVALGAMVAAILLQAPTPPVDEVARARSPDGHIDAVLVEINGGATVSFAYDVYLRPAGGQDIGLRVAHLYGATRNPNAYGANLRWNADNALRIEFERAKSAKLEQPLVTIAGTPVRVSLQPGVTDPEAPAGGMLYNLRPKQ